MGPPCRSLEECVTEHAILLCAAVQVGDAAVEIRLTHESIGNGGRADAFDHRGKGLPGETVYQGGLARVHVYHPRGNVRALEAGLCNQGVKPSPDQRIAASLRLEINQALDR